MHTISLLLLLTFCLITNTLPIVDFPFTSPGPSRILQGQVEGIKDQPVAGAINRVLPHPMDERVMYAASVNGGVWKTENAYDVLPEWRPLTDHLQSGSIGALQFDYSDETFETIVAGVGAASSFGLAGGKHAGVYLTEDGGENWEELGEELEGLRIFGVAKYMDNIVACATGRGIGREKYVGGGVFLSMDKGISFQRVRFFMSFACTDLITNPLKPDNFFLATVLGIYETEDAGKSWKTIITGSELGKYKNSRISLHSTPTDLILYGGVLTSELKAVFRAVKDNGIWNVTIDSAPTFRVHGNSNSSDDEDIHLHPEEKDDKEEAGGQGDIHFSIVADPIEVYTYYACGDRQDLPSPIGAKDYSGVCFIVNMTDTNTTSVLPLTHDFTNNGSAPHADSRHLKFDARNNLVESDDGGIYRRINPLSTNGDWFSVNGINLQVLESHSVALLEGELEIWVTGNQDVGTTMSINSDIWQTISGGDGGVVQSYTLPDQSMTTLYTTFPFLAMLMRTDINYTDVNLTSTDPNLTFDITTPRCFLTEFNTTIRGLLPGIVRFYNPYYVNRFTSERLFLPLNFDGLAFESFDGADTFETVHLDVNGNNPSIMSAIYGGMLEGNQNPDLIIATGGLFLVIREHYQEDATFITNFPPRGVNFPNTVDLSVHPEDWHTMAVLFEFGEVAISTDAAETWTVLPTIDRFVLGREETRQNKIVILPTVELTIVVSGLRGAFFWTEANGWARLGGIPTAVISDMRYSVIKDVLYFGTLGRGVWNINNAVNAFESLSPTESIPTSSVIPTETIPTPSTSTMPTETIPTSSTASTSTVPTETIPTSSTSTEVNTQSEEITETQGTDEPAEEAGIYETLVWIFIPALTALVIICIALLLLFVKASNSDSNRYTTLESSARYAN